MSSPFRPWRSDEELIHLFHLEYPDDLEVIFAGKNRIEMMWVTVNGFTTGPGGTITQYRGTLLNKPNQFETLHKGDSVHFRVVPCAPRPLVVMDGVKSISVDGLWDWLNRSLLEAGRKPEARREAESSTGKQKPWWKFWG